MGLRPDRFDLLVVGLLVGSLLGLLPGLLLGEWRVRRARRKGAAAPLLVDAAFLESQRLAGWLRPGYGPGARDLAMPPPRPGYNPPPPEAVKPPPPPPPLNRRRKDSQCRARS